MRKETGLDYERAIRCAVLAAFEWNDLLLTPADLARAAGFSAFHFSRMFGGMLGESPGEFLRRLRLERAAYRLSQGERVTTVSLDAGYERPEAFCRAFKSAFGRSPSAFRSKSLRWTLPTPNRMHFRPGGGVPPFLPLVKGHDMDVEIRDDVNAQRVVAVRHVGPYWQIGPAFGKLMGWVGASGVTPTGPGRMVSYDDPETVPEAELRSDACIDVAPDFTTDDPAVHVFDLAGGRYAVYTHPGEYAGIGPAWRTFFGQWLPGSGHQLDESRHTFETYLNDCDEVAPDELRTELFLPIR